jgi:UDP-N-acetylglucosamine--N-acetylmuramyl-(pentapeptide) pyrophosphoryl-undecaprenol N-acetylglucosamine transferase
VSGAPILIMAGGTGGHVFPALAVARALRDRHEEVVWLGTPRGLEGQVVPREGFPLERVRVSGLRRKGFATLLVAPVQLVVALVDAIRIVRRRRPKAVLGMGGFASGPGGLAAWLLRRPLVIHEQNAIAGLTNRLLAGLAREVLEAFPGSFSGRRTTQVVGNPVREDILRLPDPGERLQGRTGRLRVLVLGGSQGARVLNETVPRALALLPAAGRPDVWHQSGATTQDVARTAYRDSGVAARVEAFIEDMAAAYGWADVVICRSGALTISELAAAGLAAVLVPFPAAVDDHQTRNAEFLVGAGAAVLIPQAELTPERLAAELDRCQGDRDLVLRRARAARAMARPRATAALVEACLAAGRAA